MAERRVALVIGNSDYVDVPTLENPRNDAEDVAASLKRLGFETTVSLDADRAAMQAAIDDFSAKVEGADVALFLLCGPRDAASGCQLPDADRREPDERGRLAPHDQAQRHRVGREARQGAAHHGDRRVPR